MCLFLGGGESCFLETSTVFNVTQYTGEQIDRSIDRKQLCERPLNETIVSLAAEGSWSSEHCLENH